MSLFILLCYIVVKLGSIRIRSIWENPLWLIISSLILFSVIILTLLYFHETISPQESTSKITSPFPTKAPLSISILALQERHYSASTITKAQDVTSGGAFASEIVSFSVDGFTEYALIDTPTNPKPANGYPVVILDHGYIIPSEYSTTSSYEGVANFFAENGYIVIKPDYRGNGNSQGNKDALQRYNYPVDVLTLLASLKNIPQADLSHIYLWGHSMGGEVTLTVLEVLGKQPILAKGVKAVVLWAPVTDPAKWFSRENLKKIPESQLTPFPYSKTFSILGQPSENSSVWKSINPLNYLNDFTIPMQLNHGTSDPTVPYAWSVELVSKMKNAGKQISFISYPQADHNLSPDTAQALQNNLQFFNSNR